jgi:hypothetical protein
LSSSTHPDELFKNPSLIMRAKNEEELGVGFKVGETKAVHFTPLKVAKDMWVLDEYRIQKLRRYGIENPRMSQMHKNAREFLVAAEKALSEYRYDAFMTNARAAWSYEAKALPRCPKDSDGCCQGDFVLPCAAPAFCLLLLSDSSFMRRT